MAWSDSDHAWAMRPPKAAFIKAPFQGESVSFDGLEGLFDQSDRAPADAARPQLAVLALDSSRILRRTRSDGKVRLAAATPKLERHVCGLPFSRL